MQPNQLHVEYRRTLARELARGRYAHTHPPPARHPARRRVAAALARLAWRLDREAALRAWPRR
jgi:hypothetical protein